jgi:hypothetical protein
MDGPTTTANAAKATEAPTLYALFTQSTYPDEFKRHYRQMLEGQNLVLNQMVYDIIQGRYGGPSQTSLADSLSQSLSASMVEQARLVNLLVEHVNQGQPQDSDSILPPSQLPMDLSKEERTSQSNKRILSKIDVSEWEITYIETRPRECKRRSDTGKATQLTAGDIQLQAARVGKRKKKLCLIKKDQQQISEHRGLPPHLCYNCEQPGHFMCNCLNPQQQKQNFGATKRDHGKKLIIQGKPIQLNSTGNLPLQELPPHLVRKFESRDEILLKGVGCDAPSF